MTDKVVVLTEQTWLEIKRTHHKTDSISGPGVTNSSTDVSINRPTPAPTPPSENAFVPIMWARLGGATVIASNRWSYPFTKVIYESAGTYKTDTAAALTGTAYNTIEANNSASGVQGCGVNVDTLPSGVSLQPIGAGAVVQIFRQQTCIDPEADPPETSETQYVFQAVNQPDGVCA